MNTNATRRFLVSLAAMLNCVVAQAFLGGDVASVDTDRVRMRVQHAALQSTSPTGSYTVHEMTLSTGTVVRQYLSVAGVVFAVTWSGPFKPDVRQLLGPYFDTMIDRQAGHVHAGQPFVNQHEPDLVVESGGHPRSFVGRAYLPSAVPAGVTVQEIR